MVPLLLVEVKSALGPACPDLTVVPLGRKKVFGGSVGLGARYWFDVDTAAAAAVRVFPTSKRSTVESRL